jgi:hypothetical protein
MVRPGGRGRSAKRRACKERQFRPPYPAETILKPQPSETAQIASRMTLPLTLKPAPSRRVTHVTARMHYTVTRTHARLGDTV